MTLSQSGEIAIMPTEGDAICCESDIAFDAISAFFDRRDE
jgi:hypothetical protein